MTTEYNVYLEDKKAVLSALKLMREKEGVWWDTENPPEMVKSQGSVYNYMLNVEALRCFFDYSLLSEGIVNLMLDDEIVTEDINDIIESFSTYGFPATPYLKLEEGASIEKGKTDFSDSLCSTIDLLIRVKTYMDERGKAYNIKIPEGIKDIDELILNLFEESNKNYLKKNQLNTGEWIKFITPVPEVGIVSLYFTHQYLITVNLLFNYLKEKREIWPNFVKNIKENLEKLRKFLESLRIQDDGYSIWVRAEGEDYNMGDQFIFTVYAVESLMYLHEMNVAVDTDKLKEGLKFIFESFDSTPNLFGFDKQYMILRNPEYYRGDYPDNSTLPGAIICLIHALKLGIYDVSTFKTNFDKIYPVLKTQLESPQADFFKPYDSTKLKLVGQRGKYLMSNMLWIIQSLSEINSVKDRIPEESAVTKEVYEKLSDLFTIFLSSQKPTADFDTIEKIIDSKIEEKTENIQEVKKAVEEVTNRMPDYKALQRAADVAIDKSKKKAEEDLEKKVNALIEPILTNDERLKRLFNQIFNEKLSNLAEMEKTMKNKLNQLDKK